MPGATFPLVDGRGDPNLSEIGREQADAVAARLACEPIKQLFVTPLRRTRQTATPLAQALGIEPAVVAELIEVSLGKWEGGEYRIRAARGDPLVKRVLDEERWDLIPGGEPAEALAQRARVGIETIVSVTGPDAIAVAVAHAAVIGELCRQATGSRPFAFLHSDNGSLTRLVVQPDRRWLLRSFNETSHLSRRTGSVG